MTQVRIFVSKNRSKLFNNIFGNIIIIKVKKLKENETSLLLKYTVPTYPFTDFLE